MMTDIDILRKGAEKKQEALNLYAVGIRKVQDPRVKDLLRKLEETERSQFTEMVNLVKELISQGQKKSSGNGPPAA